jgi:hypothetical protein
LPVVRRAAASIDRVEVRDLRDETRPRAQREAQLLLGAEDARRRDVVGARVAVGIELPLDEVVDARAEHRGPAGHAQVVAAVDRERDVAVRAPLGPQPRVAEQPAHPGVELEERRRRGVAAHVRLERDVRAQRAHEPEPKDRQRARDGRVGRRFVCSSGSRPVTTSCRSSTRADGITWSDAHGHNRSASIPATPTSRRAGAPTGG